MRISVVIPVFNEQENIPVVYAAVLKELQASGVESYEFIFVDDGSKDQSWNCIQECARKDSRVKGIKLSRNFGHQAALTAGYDHVEGDAVISMDADMQDSPDILGHLIAAWRNGAEIVYARRIDRADGFLKKLTASWYYRLSSIIAEVNIPRNVGDFRLLDRKVVKCLCLLREKSRYVRGMVAWLGFKTAFVDFKRENRIRGVTGYTWRKMFKLAWDGITGFSTVLLTLPLYVGLMVIVITKIAACYGLLAALCGFSQFTLIIWGMMSIWFLLGLVMVFLGLLGQYVGRLYEQEQQRPLYIVDMTVGDVCVPTLSERSA